MNSTGATRTCVDLRRVRTLAPIINLGEPVFEEFMGVPAHPLLIHAAVVFVPLLAVLALAYALVPFVRPHVRWVLAALAVMTPGAALFAKLSGDAFFRRLTVNNMMNDELNAKILQHRDFGNRTVYAAVALALVTLALVYLVAPRRSGAGLSFGRGTAGRPGTLPLVLAAVTVIAAAVTLYYVVRTGDSGAKAVWTGF